MEDIGIRAKKIIIDKFHVDEEEVNPGAHFFTDFGADHMDIVELAMEFEKEFNISIPDAQVGAITTVEQALTCITYLIIPFRP